MPLHETLSGYWQTIQCRLFPWFEEDFGGKFVRVRGPDKIMCHLMFGVLAPAVEPVDAPAHVGFDTASSA